MKFYFILTLLLFVVVKFSEQHGRLLDPVARSSAWRKLPGFPSYYNDMAMFCGGASIQWNQNGGKCGICGENYSGSKLFERGGEFYVGTSVREYTVGQTIDVHVELTANHLGWFEFRICNVDGWETEATQECLDQTILKGIDGSTRFQIDGGVYNFYTKLVLPETLSCENCVFQWKYNTGNSWGYDPETGVSCLGCGPGQEQFYGCSDVTIRNSGVEPIISATFNTTDATSASTTKPTTLATTTQEYQTSTIPVSTTTTTIGTTTGKTTVVTSTYKPEVSNEDCKYGDGYYPDLSNDCKGYFVCYFTGTIHAQIAHFLCPNDLLFDYKGQRCDYPNAVSCTPY